MTEGKGRERKTPVRGEVHAAGPTSTNVTSTHLFVRRLSAAQQTGQQTGLRWKDAKRREVHQREELFWFLLQGEEEAARDKQMQTAAV